jgi:hypothetical protein
VGTTNSKPPGAIIVIGESKTGSTSKIVFIALLSIRFTALLRFSPAFSKLSKCLPQDHGCIQIIEESSQE